MVGKVTGVVRVINSTRSTVSVRRGAVWDMHTQVSWWKSHWELRMGPEHRRSQEDWYKRTNPLSGTSTAHTIKADAGHSGKTEWCQGEVTLSSERFG